MIIGGLGKSGLGIRILVRKPGLWAVQLLTRTRAMFLGEVWITTAGGFQAMSSDTRYEAGKGTLSEAASALAIYEMGDRGKDLFIEFPVEEVLEEAKA